MAVALTPHVSPGAPADDVPRAIAARASRGDLVFRGLLRAAGLAVLLITGMILLFLILRSTSAFQRAGFGFFTTASFFPETSNQFGVAALLPDSALIAVVALIIAVPVGVATAIYISEYAPHAIQRPLIAVIDLMAAIPSIIYALWGLFFLMRGSWDSTSGCPITRASSRSSISRSPTRSATTSERCSSRPSWSRLW